METIINFIVAHWEDILAGYGFVVGVCTTIVKATSTTKDDAIWEKVIKILDFFSTAYRKIDAAKLKKESKNG